MKEEGRKAMKKVVVGKRGKLKRSRQNDVEKSVSGVTVFPEGKKISKRKECSGKPRKEKLKNVEVTDGGILSWVDADERKLKKKAKVEKSQEEEGMETIIYHKKRKKEKHCSQENGSMMEKKHRNEKRKEQKRSKVEKVEVAALNDVLYLSSGDEDNSKGMQKWLTEYHRSKTCLKDLQQSIDRFLVDHDKKLEQERKEREASAAEDGWTVVQRHRGNKKTTEADTGISVESASRAAVENQLSKKKPKELGNFYRFQKREAQMNEILMLQSKFEEDRKRIQQLRAARKFRPY